MKLHLSLFLSFIIYSSLIEAKLLIIGGGKRNDQMLTRMIELAGGVQGNILIIPLASEIPDEVVETIKKELTNLGAKNITGFSCSKDQVDRADCLAQIKKSKVIFFTGGDQNRLLNAFNQTSAEKLIKERYEKESDLFHLVGTSAGAAIMSEVMLTGLTTHENMEFDGIRPNMVEVKKGFGFVKKLIIDQHFLKRSRHNRLMSVVLDHPQLIGVGIDEETAIEVDKSESFRVLGASTVLVIDAKSAKIKINGQAHYETSGVKIDILGNNQVYLTP